MSEKTKNSSPHIGLLTADLSHKHGWAHYSLSLIQALQRAGVNLTVIATQDSPDVEGIVAHMLLPPGMSIGYGSLLRQTMLVPRVRPLLANCDVIHAAIEPFAPLAAWVAGARPLFITGHGTYVRAWSELPWPMNILYRQAFLRARLVCVSHYTAKVARETLPDVKAFVVKNGVDVERFQYPHPLTPSPLHREGEQGITSIETQRPTVLAVGGLKGRKGTLELVRAMAAVRREMPNVRCIIIGSLNIDPPYVARVRAAIHELGLADSVQLLGQVSPEVLIGWYHAADVFALPSMHDGKKFEGFGLVHLEASAAGLPVIGTTDCGAEDAIDDGVTGLLVSQAQVADKLPQAILHILRNPALAARMGEAGRAKAAGQTWDHVAAQMLALYNEGR